MVGVRARASVLVLAIAAAFGLSCHGNDEPAADGPEADIDSQLMHAKDSHVAVLYPVPVGQLAIAITHNPTVHDAMTDWGACMEQFRHCYRTVTGPILECAKNIKLCPANAATGTANACCPKQCVDDFDEHISKLGQSEEDATVATIMRGDCIAGFREMLPPEE